MTFFESMLALLLAAIILLQLSRRLSLPYPAMLAGAGVLLAFVPGSPVIQLEPNTALALFIAPVLMDAAYDFPLGAAKRFWVPLITFAVLAVLVTAAVVTWLGISFMHLPLFAALALGAIVAPPDAAAATAVLRSVSIPRSSDSVLKGESLFNDASALLLFNAAILIQSRGSMTAGVGLRLGMAVPGGLLLGIVLAHVARRINPLVKDTLGGNVLQFVLSFLVWIVAIHLHLSAVLCVIAFAMTLARRGEEHGAARMRVHSYAVWSSVVFTLNVLAFLIMGMQTRSIVLKMGWEHARSALGLASLVVIAVVLTRMIFVVGFNRLVSWNSRRKGQPEPASLNQAILVGWSGMRGFLTMVTAFSLPGNFPQRDLVVLTAFSVVIATLVIQGMTLTPLIRVLNLNSEEAASREVAGARVQLANAALVSLSKHEGKEADNLRFVYTMERDAAKQSSEIPTQRLHRRLGHMTIAAERRALEEIRSRDELGSGAYLELQEELDWRELTFLRDADRRIEEI